MMPDQGVAVQKVGELEIKSVYHFFSSLLFALDFWNTCESMLRLN